MGFSFRSLYTDDDQLEKRAVLSSLTKTPASITATGRPNLPQAVKSGIPGPLKAAKAVPSRFKMQMDGSAYTSLDELEPEPVFNEASSIPHSIARPFVEADNISTAPDPTGRGPHEAEITLRAIFSTSETFTVERIAVLTAKLPGITSCIIKTPERTVLATREQESAHTVDTLTDFPRFELLQPSCDLLGLGKMSGAMLRSNSDSVSCFSYAGVRLMAKHSGIDLEPGLWEKLTLITQASAEMNVCD